MDLDEAIENRRTIRVFKPDNVPQEHIDKIIYAGTMAPSSCNRQHWQFVVVKKQETKDRIYKEAGSQLTIGRAPVAIACFVNTDFNTQHYSNVQSVAAAIQNMKLKAYSLGYGTCWVVGFGKKEKINEILNVPGHYEAICILLIGKPAQNPSKPARRDISKVMHLERYEGDRKGQPRNFRPSKWTLEQIKENQRFTSRAKEMKENREWWHKDELDTIKNIIQNENLKGNVLTLFNYDGTAFRHIREIYDNNPDIKLTGCELTQEAYDILKAKSRKDMDYKIYTNELPFKQNTFDTVITVFGLERFPDRKKLIKEIQSVLKPGGKFLIFFKNKLSAFGISYFLIEKLTNIKDMNRFWISPDPYEPVSIIKLKRSLKNNNFKIETKPLYFIAPEFSTYARKLGPYLKRHYTRAGPFMNFAGKILLAIDKLTKNRPIPLISSSYYIKGIKQ